MKAPTSDEAPENVRLIGGEMLLWSDMAAMGGVTEWRGAALELIRRTVPESGRVLLVGPHPRTLVDDVVARAPSAAALLRSYPDACALGARHPELEVFCGRLELLDAEEPYDLVLAMDGLLRTHSAEAPAAAWSESLGALADLVAPGGRLVLGVRNDLGVDRFIEARPADRECADDQWAPHGFDPSYPSGPEALDLGLESAGLSLQRCYAAYPDRRAPRSLLSREALAFELPEALTFPLSARDGDRMLVADPLRLSRLVFRHRLGRSWPRCGWSWPPGRPAPTVSRGRWSCRWASSRRARPCTSSPPPAPGACPAARSGRSRRAGWSRRSSSRRAPARTSGPCARCSPGWQAGWSRAATCRRRPTAWSTTASGSPRSTRPWGRPCRRGRGSCCAGSCGGSRSGCWRRGTTIPGRGRWRPSSSR
ncbi:class I SAM-dependent methyltransferase [Nonomuraea thailandensis]